MQALSRSSVSQAFILGTVIVVITVLMAQYWPLGADYYHTYRPTVENWLHGETLLYDENAPGFYNLPWAVLILIPIALVPLRLGEALMNVASIVCIVTAIDIFRRARPVPSYVVLLAIGNLHVLDLLVRGQVDAFVLLAVTLGWWSILTHRPLVLSLALCVMAIKPVNVALAGLLYLLAIRHWSRRDIATVLSIPVIVLIISILMAGADWPLRYIQYARDYPVPNRHRSIDIWDIASTIGLPRWPVLFVAAIAIFAFLREAWHEGVTLWTVSLALVTNFAFTYYASGYHYVLLIPALLLVASHSRVLLVLAYLATWTPLVRLADETINHWDYLYLVLLFLSLWALAPRERGRRPALEREAHAAQDVRSPATPA